MKAGMINGSPKVKNSASEVLIKDLLSCLHPDIHTHEFKICKPSISPQEVAVIRELNAIVFVFPLYVDGIPSHLLSVMCDLESMIANSNINVYAVINCGFHEGLQNKIALEIVENWCIKTGLIWSGGIGLGGGPVVGEMDIPLGKALKKTLGREFHALARSIANSMQYDTKFISINFPRKLYKLMGNMSWKKLAKKNGLTPSDLDFRH